MAALAMGVQFGNTVSAMERVSISWGGRQIFDVQYYDVEDGNAAIKDFYAKTKAPNTFVYNLKSDIKDGLNKAFYWWAELLGPGAKINQPVQYFVNTSDFVNAAAMSRSLLHGNDGRNPDRFAEIIQKGRVVPYYNNLNDLVNDNTSPEQAFGLILIGENLGVNENDGRYGWVNAPYYALPLAQSMRNIEITPVMYHEIAHSVGISAGRKENPYGLKYDEEVIRCFEDAAANPANLTFHLHDQYGKKAEPGMLIMATQMLQDETLRSQYREKVGKELKAEDVFLMDNVDANNGRGGKTGAYFSGDNVKEVLAGKTFTRLDGNAVCGIPMNMWEGGPELSHIELARSMMSHQNYRSYNNFIEAELAILQDIGYNIDRKNFFGRSIYNDHLTLINEQGFSKRENGKYVNGYNSSTMGIGLHVFGSYNDITQRGNIWTDGYGAAGIRVDGIQDKITVAKGTEIHGDGTLGTGVLLAYGRNHDVTINGTVTANGEGGDAVHFEFGANSLGGNTEYRGSYMRYVRKVSNCGEISSAINPGLKELADSSDDYSITDLEHGDFNAPMASLTVNGKLESKSGAAIYIAEEALVDKIDINKGAEINGDIKSVWKQFDKEAYGLFDKEQTITYHQKNAAGEIETQTGYAEPLYIQYNGGKYVYNQYIPDLVTNLNFNLQDGAMLYQGNISGTNNMKMNVKSGDLLYTGTADVVNINVAKGAGLYGGTYTVNDMTARMGKGFSDDTTGKFINHGTIGAARPDSVLTVNGNLESDGVLQAYGGGSKGNIAVSGTANVEGSVVTAKNALPDETLVVLNAGAINGKVANPDGNPHAITGLLSTTGTNDGKTLKVTTQTANNLGELTAEQAEAYEAMEGMQRNLVGDTRREELRTLYNLNSASAKNALTEIGVSSGPQAVALTQQSTLASHVISDRLSTAFSLQPVNVSVPASHLADGEEGDGLKLSTKLPVAQDNNAWVKFTKNWGDLKGGANYHGSAVSGGYDRKLSANWRGGLFLSYQTTGFGAQSGNGNIYDTRFGIYAGYHKNAADAYLYADYGWIKNKLRRSIGTLGLGAEAKYNSHLMEIGGEYKYDLHANDGKTWHVSPYAGFQLSWLNQDGYTENGAGIFNQQVDGKHNTYFAGQIGMEFKRYLGQGSYGMRLGVKHAFAGADPELSFRYEGYGGKAYTLRNNQDKTHFIFSLSGETEFAKGWFLSGETLLQKGTHDKDISASVQFKRVW